MISRRDDEQIKREFMQELLKNEIKEDVDMADQRDLSGFEFFPEHREPFSPIIEEYAEDDQR